MTLKQYKATIIEHTGEGVKKLVLDAPEIARDCVPGQFVHLLCADPSNSNDPLLRRPFSIHDADSKTGSLSLLYEVKGRGTTLLAKLLPGGSVDIIGPLGNGFTLPQSNDEQVILVGGGMGAAPIYFLARMLGERLGAGCMGYLMGARTSDAHVCHDDFVSLCPDDAPDAYLVCTDDGTLGDQAFVTKLLNDRLDAMGEAASPIIYACGPTPMLRAVSAITRARGLRCQISTEEKMACGIGACMGCAIKVRDGESWKYVRCCKEGPVFDADEVIWE